MSKLVISETHIRIDDCGRYCLNDLHRASGSARKHTPGRFTITKQFKDLVGELSLNRDNGEPVTSTQGVGTFVAKELVYAYAMWISPAFALKVIRTYDGLMQQQIDKLNALSVRRARAELEYLEAQADASRCGFGLRKWRDIGPALETRIQALKDESQPGLFLN